MIKLKHTIRRKYINALIAYAHAINQDKDLNCRMYWLGNVHALQDLLQRKALEDIIRTLHYIKN